MSKKRKTRQQKMIADLRRKVSSPSSPKNETPSSLPAQSLQSYEYVIQKPQQAIATTSTYSFEIKDIYRTSILVAFLIGAELVLFFLLKGKVITIPMLIY